MNYCTDYLASDVTRIEEIKTINHHSDKKLGIKQIFDAVLLPGTNKGGGIVSEERYYEESAMHINHAYAHPYNYDEKDVIIDDSEVLYIGMLDPVWGHCITDNLKNMWVFFENELPFEIKNIKIVYTTNNSANKLPKNFIDLLFSVGIDLNSFICVRGITRFKKIYLPDSCFYCDSETSIRFYTDEYIGMINDITEFYTREKTSDAHKKVYFSREHWKSPKDFGEKYVRKAFEDNGYFVIYPESLSLEEQISIINQCDTLATTDGSIAHNALFMRNGSELIIVRKASYLNEYQSLINELRDLNVVLIDANKSNMLLNKDRQWSGPFFMYANKYLCGFLNIQIPHFPVFGYLHYCITSITRKVKILIEKILASEKKRRDTK